MTQLFGMVIAVGLTQITLDLLMKGPAFVAKKLKVNEIESELKGILYQTTKGFPTCLYDYRETGTVTFLSTDLI